MRHTLAAIGLVTAGIALGLGAGFYAWHVPGSYRDCVLTYVKSGMSNEVARIIRDTCKERFLPPKQAVVAVSPAGARPSKPAPTDRPDLFGDLYPKSGEKEGPEAIITPGPAEKWWKKYERREEPPEAAKDSQTDQ